MDLAIGDLLLDVGQRRVSRAGSDLKLPALSFDLLLVLAKRAPDVVSVAQLMDAVWPDSIVTPETISQRVKLLRQALGDDPSSARYLASVRGRGYRIVAPVVEIQQPTIPTRAVDDATPHRVLPFPASKIAGWVRRATVWLLLLIMICAGNRFHPTPVVRSTNDRSIIVLPFADLSELADQKYLADGLADEIQAVIAKVPELKVIGRASAGGYRGTDRDLREIRSRFGASFALEGSVRRSGDRIRVTTELVDTRDGSQRWTDVYDRTFADLLDAQNEIAMSLVRAVRIELLSAAMSNPPASGKAGMAAYLRGLHAADRFDQEGFEEATADFRRSRELSPSFPAPAESLALTLGFASLFGFLPPEVGFERARTAAIEALGLAPHSAIPHLVLSMVLSGYDHDWLAARQEADAALALEHNNAVAL